MSAGYLLLYAALAVVAVWLVAELLFQHRAPVHWRALALVGFLTVVAGMSLSSVPVIGAGAAAFAVGQVFVTLAVKQGRPVGWSLRRPDGSLPGPLARVPLLSAATGGAVAAAAVAASEPVGEVGPVEAEAPAAIGYEYEQMQELSAEQSVYAPAAEYYPQEQQQYVQPEYQYQVDPYGQQQWQQQPVVYDGYQQQPAPGYGYEYQDPYGQQQQQWQQQVPQQQGWEYQQQPYQG
ncbi:hypothetical protein ABT095_35565 [Kitasatospora sp. NPDC002227]|uniref:hypothetical protein n=1 Tax=Kitasatospora sp. NPDC002227 TaxID=3154773 RepID=UPI0033191EFB